MCLQECVYGPVHGENFYSNTVFIFVPSSLMNEKAVYQMAMNNVSLDFSFFLCLFYNDFIGV